MTPGTVLASARKAAGLSIADVAAQLRLSPRQVQALEADRYEALPGTVFVRGFIRNYARALKLDPEPLLNALEPAPDEEAPLRVQATSGSLPLGPRRSHVKPLMALFCTILVAVLAAGGYELWSRQKDQKPAVVADASRAQAPQPAITTVEPPQSQAPLGQSMNAAPEPDAQAPAAASQPPAGESPPAAAPSEPAAPDQTGARMGRLRVQFNADSWLEVRDRGGAVLFIGTGQAGTERTFEAPSPLSVVIGNATGVRITYNGVPLDFSSHAARNIARLTLE
jgi:cytoskeleton protein RodZ